MLNGKASEDVDSDWNKGTQKRKQRENREREPGGDDDQVYYYYNNITMILEPGLPWVFSKSQEL